MLTAVSLASGCTHNAGEISLMFHRVLVPEARRHTQSVEVCCGYRDANMKAWKVARQSVGGLLELRVEERDRGRTVWALASI